MVLDLSGELRGEASQGHGVGGGVHLLRAVACAEVAQRVTVEGDAVALIDADGEAV